MPITAFWNIIVLAGGHNNNTLISKACNVNVHSISRCDAVCCHFYRAMLCIAQTVLSKDVCLSVYLSLRRRYSVETAEHIVKLFSPSATQL